MAHYGLDDVTVLSVSSWLWPSQYNHPGAYKALIPRGSEAQNLLECGMEDVVQTMLAAVAGWERFSREAHEKDLDGDRTRKKQQAEHEVSWFSSLSLDPNHSNYQAGQDFLPYISVAIPSTNVQVSSFLSAVQTTAPLRQARSLWL